MRPKILITLFLGLTLSMCFTPSPVKAGPSKGGENPPALNEIRSMVANTYLSQVGVKELTGHNDGIQVERYLASADLVKGDPWCAAFVNWCFEQNGIKGPDKLAGYSPSWFPNALQNPSHPNAVSHASRADVFGIYYASKGRIAHVGFIDRWCDTYAITVEGNTNDDGSRDGTSVCKKRRLTRQIYATYDWITPREAMQTTPKKGSNSSLRRV